MASKLQARFKGWLWRARLRQMSSAAVLLQAIFRGFRGRRIREAEERKRLEGMPVELMMERGVTISDIPLVLRVKRCGLSFKFEGYDPQQCLTYVGFMCVLLSSSHVNR